MLKYGAYDITIGVFNGHIQPILQLSAANVQQQSMANGRKLRVVRFGVVGLCVAVVVFLVEVR